MASRMREMFQFCRFCLNRDDLNYLTQAEDPSFTTQDIERYTGIRISDEEKSFSAICGQCCSVLEKSVAFRKACLRNDILFNQLLSTQNESSQKTIEISKDSNHFDDTASVEIEKEETRRLLTTLDLNEGLLNTEEEKDETRMLLISSEVDEDILNTKEQRTAESTDEREEKPNPTEDEVQMKPKKRFKRKIQLCSICGKLVNNLNGHNQNHIKEKKYSCPHCQLKMSNPTNMKRHIESVHEKKIIVCCDQCGKGFTHKNTYSSHMMLHHGIGKTYECTVCSKTFNTHQKYSAHKIKWHTMQEEVSCTICQMMFRSKKQLAIHQRVHSADQPYACAHCSKRFKSPYARKIHQLTHSGIRFPCTLCGKSYSYKSLLNMHLRKDHPDTLTDAS
uniref:Protein krueppel n=1 Tax=Anopheles atroparvus TaxID=41427 RepID=A0AAG5DH14_ANOAO